MESVARRGVVLASLLASLAGLGCSASSDSGGGSTAPPFPAEAGIQQNLSLTTLQGAGWRVCFQGAYNQAGTTVDTLLAGCSGHYLMLACRSSASSDTIALSAAETRAVVVQPDAEGATEHHVANGVGWYFTDTQAWGFFPASDTLNRGGCDFDDGTQTSKDLRLCWHMDAGSLGQGYRCGDNTLDLNAAWQRMVLDHP